MTAVERFQSFIDTGWSKENISTWLKSLTDEQREEIRIHVSKMTEMISIMIHLCSGEIELDEKWISVTDRLPPDNEEIWIHDVEMGVTIGHHDRYGWYYVYGDDDGQSDDGLYEVTHWQPMDRPEPPTETK